VEGDADVDADADGYDGGRSTRSASASEREDDDDDGGDGDVKMEDEGGGRRLKMYLNRRHRNGLMGVVLAGEDQRSKLRVLTGRGHEQCLDADLIRPDLFDEALLLLSSNVQISPALRKAFGLDKPLPLSTLTLQLQNLILHPEGTPGIAKKLKSVTKELAVRELTDEEAKNIGLIVGDQKWMTISSTRVSRVSDTAHAVLPVPLKGCCEIHSSITDREEVWASLRKMGCSERLSAFRFHFIYSLLT
jgi:hypothetical protein